MRAAESPIINRGIDMARKAGLGFDEKSLSKGQLRKLTALRKLLGDDIANGAFAAWLESAGSDTGSGADKNADMIADAVMELVNEKNLRFPRGGYIVRRGRGRVIVERPEGAED
jgi:hypothetical protein